jgi:CubicO group peptidase (beta-lactamase class C family)
MNKTFRGYLLFLCLLALLVDTAHAQRGKSKEKNQPPVSIGSLADASFRGFGTTGLSLAVVKDGEMIYSGGFGLKSVTDQSPMDPRAVFNIASCSKAFTAASIALLVERKLVNWDDKVIDYIPGFQLADPWITAQLTLRDLLCHRSGLGTFYGDLLWYGTDYTDEEILSRLRHLPLNQQFRSEFGYQNNLYMVAGLVVKAVTGLTWEEFIQKNFFDPLGMKDTRGSSDQLRSGDNIAFGHIQGKQQAIFDFNGAKPAASIYSSVEDLSKWIAALLEGIKGGSSVLAKESIRTLWSAHTIIPVSPNSESWGIHFRAYALGWNTFDYGGRKIVEHDGGMPGYISKVCLVPEENLGFVILNNGQDFQVNDALRYKLLDHFLQKTPARDWDATFLGFRNNGALYESGAKAQRAASQMKGTQPSLDLKAYTGMFEDPSYGTAKVELSGKELNLTFMPTKTMFTGTLSHWHFDTFKVQFKDDFLTYGLVTFEVGPEGKVQGFRIDLPSDDFQFFELDFKPVP